MLWYAEEREAAAQLSVKESVGFMAVPFSAFGSTVPRVAKKLLKGMAKRQKQD